MPVPDFQTLMLPVLRILDDGQEHAPVTVRQRAALEFNLTEADLAELLPSGRQTTFANRVAWALAYLKQARLLDSPRRGSYRITDRGKEVLSAPPTRVDIDFLKQFPEFQEFRFGSGGEVGTSPADDGRPATSPDLTPDEQLRQGYARLRESIAAQLLDRIKQASPKFFEALVVDLLVAMGYGGTREDAASVVGGGGDEGIDGIIKEDPLGLDTIYIQAKRWSNTVGRPDIQRFAGALQGQRARKGVFITTSAFSADARSYAGNLQTTIILIDGPQLADLMLKHGVAVTESASFKVWKIDEDYFSDDGITG
jgi:restriction system protein